MVSDGTPLSSRPRSRAKPPTTTIRVRRRKRPVCSSMRGMVLQKRGGNSNGRHLCQSLRSSNLADGPAVRRPRGERISRYHLAGRAWIAGEGPTIADIDLGRRLRDPGRYDSSQTLAPNGGCPADQARRHAMSFPEPIMRGRCRCRLPSRPEPARAQPRTVRIKLIRAGCPPLDATGRRPPAISDRGRSLSFP